MAFSKATRKTQQAFFALLQAGLWPTENNNNNVGAKGVDWGRVYRLAEEQSVIGLIAAGIDFLLPSDRPPQEIVLQFIGETLQSEQRNKAMNTFVAFLIQKMRVSEIYALLVKGQGLAQCYKNPVWRSSGDIDLFLSDENYEKAKAFLMPLASKVEAEAHFKKHLGLIIDGWLVELHGSLRSGLSNRVDRVLDEIRDDTFYGGNVRSWNNNGVQIFMLAPENNAIYVFSHILDHFYKGGIGLRQICDWCRLMWTYRDTLNHDLLESRIRKAGLMNEWKAFGAVAVDWLGMPAEAMPFYSSYARWSEKAEKIKDFVMEVGNFGHNRDMSYYENKPFIVRKAISFKQRVSDLCRHARIFPVNSLRFFWGITVNGVYAAMVKDKR